MRFKLVEDVDKLGALDKLDSLFGQSDVYMWSTYILPNGRFLNPDNYYTNSDELDYEHSDFINFVKNTFGVSCWDAEDLFDEYCIKMNVTYPYLALPKNKPTIKQFQSIKDVISNKESFIYSVADIEDRVGDLGNAKEPLMILTPFDETAFDLSIYSADDVVKEINKAYMTKSFLNESKVRKDLIDLTNRKFGDLTVIEYDKEKSRATGETYWKCKCSCGNETIVSRKHLLNGDIKSCGHTKRQNGLDHYEDNFKGMRDRQNKYHTNLEIIRNQKMQPNNTSGVKGVDYHKGRDMWRARVRVNGKELTKWSKDKDVAIKWRQDAIDKYYKPQIDKAIKAGDLKEELSKYDDPVKLYNTLPKMVYHATLQETLPKILDNGLKNFWVGQDLDECIEYVKMNHDCDYEDIVVIELPKKLLNANKCDFTVDLGDGWSDAWSGTFIYEDKVLVNDLDSYWVDDGKWYYLKDIEV